MDDLGLTDLTDDQLIALLRAVMAEAGRRHAAVAAASQEAYLDEAERARIAKEAAKREAAKLRAAERERVAKEAAEAVRQRVAKEAVEAGRDKARQASAAAAAEERQRQAEAKEWLQRAASLVDREPGEISLIWVHTRFGSRILINEGCDRYAREHLVDYRAKDKTIKTTRALVQRKPDLIALCVEFAARHDGRETILCGADYTWTANTHTAGATT